MAVAAALFTLPGAVHASTQSAAPQVGAVSFVLGRAWIRKPGDSRELIDVGTAISVHDSIETDSNGFVHIRFVDNALVAVRSSSTLDVVRYDYDAAAPERSAVKFNLEEGVTRAISGKAAKEARQNFRMNTPIAAIGVRGTDFVVRASRTSVRAQVNEGAIVVAPFSGTCTAAAFGPCSVNALELTGMSSEVLEISSATLNPVLLPTAGSATQMAREQAVIAAAPAEEQKEKNGDLYTESVSARAVNQQLAVNSQGGRPAPEQPKPPVVALPEFTPEVPVAVAALTNNQLVWGRWSDTALRSDERITVAYATARESDRKVTVGNNIYALYRSEPGPQVVQPGLGTLGFNLNQAQAIYTSQGRSELMNVYGGDLSIDFDLNRFATSLQLGHSATGNVEFSSSGRVYGAGNFYDRTTAGQAMAGAVSLDGKEAGYFFEKALQNGHIDGLTLWGMKP